MSKDYYVEVSKDGENWTELKGGIMIDNKMTNKEFVSNALNTESPNFYQPNPRVLHAAMGCVTESAELMDALKKQIFYGRELDVVNVKEEAGDILYYLAILFDELDTTFEAEMKRVINKLKVRFPDKFSEKNAFERDLENERESLERGSD